MDRNGIRAASSGENESLAKGTKWTEMVGEMVMLSVGPGDQARIQPRSYTDRSVLPKSISKRLIQVLGVSESDRSVVFRTGVSHSDLSGKTWRPVTAAAVRMRSPSSYTASSTSSTPRQAKRVVAGEGREKQIIFF